MKRILSLIGTPNARLTAFYYFSNIFSGSFRYLFHVVLLRLLAPSEYGEFLSYLSLIYILGIPTVIVSSVVTKYVSVYRGKGDEVSINKLFYYLLNKISVVTMPLGILLMLLSAPLSVLFKAHYLAFIVLGISLFISVFQVIISAYVFAFQKIVFQTIAGFMGVIVTIILAVIFIKLGFGATGVVSAQILSGVLISAVSFLVIHKSVYPRVVDNVEIKFNMSGFVGYSFIYAVGTTLMVSLDVLMIRVFFDSHLSGLYSSVAVLGRMILFGLTPLISLVFPVAAHRHAQNAKTKSIFIKLGLAIFTFGAGVASVFSLFSYQIISLLSKPEYLEAAPWLSYIAFGMALFAFSQFIISYMMATDRPQANILLLTATIVQPVVLFAFRGSFTGSIVANFVLQLVLFLSLFLYIVSKDFFAGFEIGEASK